MGNNSAGRTWANMIARSDTQESLTPWRTTCNQLCEWPDDLRKVDATNEDEPSNIFHCMMIRMVMKLTDKEDDSLEQYT